MNNPTLIDQQYVTVKVTTSNPHGIHEVIGMPTSYAAAMRLAIELMDDLAVWSLYTGRILYPVRSDMVQVSQRRMAGWITC